MTSPWNKPEWQNGLEEDETDPHIEALTDVAVVVLIVLLACVCAGIVYQVCHPFVNEVISNWEFKP